MNAEQINERYSRQRDIVPPDRIAACKATVIGVGAIGRQVALQLAAMGIPSLQLVDFDVVEPSNLASQGYLEEDSGKLKVEVTANLCRKINKGFEIQTMPERFRRSMEIGNMVFCCVDKIDVRRLIWESVKDKELLRLCYQMHSPALSVGGLYRDCSGQLQERIAEEDPGKVRSPRAPLGTNMLSMSRNCGVAGTRFAGSTEYQ